jgi:hypothetical protein
MKSYSEYMQEISPDELFDRLIAFGLFADKIPPFFTGEAFLKYLKKEKPGLQKKEYDYIKYENLRNINVPRILAIPHPFAHANLVGNLSENWPKLQAYFKEQTKHHKHKISKIHLRKMKDVDSLFQMNYKAYEDDSEHEIDLQLGKRFQVGADISNCFPSIYSHSIPWALVGKKIAKQKQGDKKYWPNKLDFNLRNSKNAETNGLLIGPHTSNLLSEVILVQVDQNLRAKNYGFVRHIDDYLCFTVSFEKAEDFLKDLSTELKHFELNLNHKKSNISELPKASIRHWVRKLKKHRFVRYKSPEDNEYYLPTKEVEIFLDLAIDLMSEGEDNSAIINYAVKVIIKKNLDEKAKNYFLKRLFNLVFLFPYLAQILDEFVLQKLKPKKAVIKEFGHMLFDLGVERRMYELSSYALFFAVKYNFKLAVLNLSKTAFHSEDCVLMTSAYIYAVSNGESISEYEKHALKLKVLDFDRNWLFIYEVLKATKLDGEIKAMKAKKVSFITKKF